MVGMTEPDADRQEQLRIEAEYREGLAKHHARVVAELPALIERKKAADEPQPPKVSKGILALEALGFVRGYRGRSRFIYNLQNRAKKNPGWRPSAAQAKVVMKIRSEEADRKATRQAKSFFSSR